MKIAIDGRFWGLTNAGLGRYSMNLVENLAKIDHKNEYFIILREKYFKSVVLSKNFTKVLFDSEHYSLAEQVKLPKILSGINPDLTHFLHFNVPINFKGKFVVTIHDLLMHRKGSREASTLGILKYLTKRVGYKKVFAKAVNDSQKIIVPTNWVKGDLLINYSISEEKIQVIYEGVSMKPGKQKKKGSKEPYFLYVGNAYPHKNLERLIEATVLLNKKRQGKLIIVTPRGVFEKRLGQSVKRFNAEKMVEIKNYIDDEKLKELMMGAVGYVFPSLDEGFGLPGLEAMSVGTLVLASDIPVFHEVYEDAAVYFNPFDFSKIAEAMEDSLIMNMEKKKEYTEKGKKLVRKYSWEKMAKETLQIYQEL